MVEYIDMHPSNTQATKVDDSELKENKKKKVCFGDLRPCRN